MDSKLPPVDPTKEDRTFEKEIVFTKCSHKQATYDRQRGEIRCPCGAAFSGERLGELAKLLGLDK